MSDELPELHQAVLDAATLAALFDDLEGCAAVLDVLVKGGPTARAGGRPVPLREAQAALAAGDVQAVQIRYQFEGAEWRDTLMAGPAGVRIVRMKMPV